MKILLFIAAAMAALAAASCNAPSAQTPAPPSAVSPEPTAASPDAVAAHAPSSPEGDGICARGICGCWHDAALSYRLQINDAQGAPVEGVEGICQGETEAIARASPTGLLTFDLATQQSPGCGYRRCNTLMLVDAQGRYTQRQVSADAAGGGVVVLERQPR